MTSYWFFFLFYELKWQPIIGSDVFRSLLGNHFSPGSNSSIMILKGLLLTGCLADVTSALVSSTAPEWALILREFGSFGLIAFIVYWYATHVAPSSQKQYLDASSQMKTEFMEHNRAQRVEAVEMVKSCQAESMRQLDRQREDYLNALGKERATYVDSMEKQRADFIRLRDEDRKLLERFVDSANNLFGAVREHMDEARIVWRERGDIPYEVSVKDEKSSKQQSN